MKQDLREGFTTGSAAAAAIYGAICVFAGRAVPETVLVPVPPFRAGRPAGRLRVPVAERAGAAYVIKDGGDDPDATHGMRITARASDKPFPEGSPVPLPAACLPAKAARVGTERTLRICVYAGEGIGRVTLPGLPVAPGEPAVNPAPRKQIALAAVEAARACDLSGDVHILLSAPEGEARAAATLNGRLGIVGGISILGTQGIVRPYSHDAWRTAVEQGISVARALECDCLLFSTGRRSERTLQRLYPEQPQAAFIQVADFAGAALRAGVRAQAARIIWGCYPGKLLKAAQGLEWTHAKNAPADIGLLLSLLRECALPEQRDRLAELTADLQSMPTAAGVSAFLLKRDAALHHRLLHRLAAAAYTHMRLWMREAAGMPEGPAGRPSEPLPLPSLQLHVFNLEQEPSKEALLLSFGESDAMNAEGS